MWWIFITGKDFHQRDEFSSWWRISIWIEPVYFNRDTMKNLPLQLSISITMIIILWIFVLVDNFHRNKWFSSKMNIHKKMNFLHLDEFQSQCIFFHYHGRFLSQWWTFFTMPILHRNEKFSSQRNNFITMLIFYHHDECSSQW